MIILFPSLAEEVALFQIFSYYVRNAIGVNRIVVIVKYTIGKLEQIVAKTSRIKSQLQLLANVLE